MLRIGGLAGLRSERDVKIALLEDDPSQAELLTHWLTQAGHICVHFELAQAYIGALADQHADIAIVDWQLPDLRGDAVIEALRGDLAWRGPIILATANEDPTDISAALALGADEYIMKPIAKAQLLARIDALCPTGETADAESDLVEYPPYQLDRRNKSIRYGERMVSLEPLEFGLALALFRNSGRMLRHTDLEQIAVGTTVGPRATIDDAVAKVRAKLALSPAVGWRLSSVFDQGYRLERIS